MKNTQELIFGTLLFLSYLALLIYFQAPTFNYLVSLIIYKYIYTQNIIVLIVGITTVIALSYSIRFGFVFKKTPNIIAPKSSVLFNYIYNKLPVIQTIFLILIFVTGIFVIVDISLKGTLYFWYNNNIYFFKKILTVSAIVFSHIVFIRLFPKKCWRNTIFILTGIIITLLSFHVFFILYKFNYIFGDQIALANGDIAINIFKSTHSDRYFPFALLHYYLLYKNGAHLYIYLLANCLILLLSLLFIYLAMLKENYYNNKIIALLTIIGILLIPSIAQIFNDIIFPELGMFLMLSLFLFLYALADKKPSYFYYSIAAIPCFILVFYKETAFIIPFIVGIGNLIFGWKITSRHKKYFYFLLISIACFFLLMYGANYYDSSSIEENYLDRTNAIKSQQQLAIINQLYKTNIENISPKNHLEHFLHVFHVPILIIALFMSIFRAYKLIFFRNIHLLKVDMLLFASITWCVSYVVLKLTTIYYMAPAILIAIYSLSIYAQYYYKKLKSDSKQLNKKVKLKIYLFLFIMFIHTTLIVNQFRSILDYDIFYQTNRQTNMNLVNVLANLKQQNINLVYKYINYSPFKEYNSAPFVVLNGSFGVRNLESLALRSFLDNDNMLLIKQKAFHFTEDNQLLIIGLYYGYFNIDYQKEYKLLLQLSGVYSDKPIYYLGSNAYYSFYSLKPIPELTKILNTPPKAVILYQYDKKLDNLSN